MFVWVDVATDDDVLVTEVQLGAGVDITVTTTTSTELTTVVVPEGPSVTKVLRAVDVTISVVRGWVASWVSVFVTALEDIVCRPALVADPPSYDVEVSVMNRAVSSMLAGTTFRIIWHVCKAASLVKKEVYMLPTL